MVTPPPIMSVPCKKAFEVNLSTPIRAFISATYGDKDDYSFAAEAFNQLRTSALLTSTRSDRLNQMFRYYDQLVAIKNKIPISENQIRVGFKWQDAMDKGKMLGGKRTLTLSKAGYEQACVLFNIGAWCGELAVSQPLDHDSGLKQAVKYLQTSAGAFEHLRDNVLTMAGTDVTADLYPQVSALLALLMIAQANELTLGKGVKDSAHAYSVVGNLSLFERLPLFHRVF
ncbi:hypothetical protein ACOME3_007992, partial [Neoechinorhynchus agilis]